MLKKSIEFCIYACLSWDAIYNQKGDSETSTVREKGDVAEEGKIFYKYVCA